MPITRPWTIKGSPIQDAHFSEGRRLWAAWDAYRRFIQMFANVVLEIEHENFEEVLEGVKKENPDEENTNFWEQIRLAWEVTMELIEDWKKEAE